MSKSFFSFCFILIISLGSCSKQQTIEQDEQAIIYDYLEIWKELTQEQNNFDENFLNNHFTIKKNLISEWSQGFTFSIIFDYQVDWAKVSDVDRFPVKIKSPHNPYTKINLPKDRYLTKEEIERANRVNTFNRNITAINTSTELKYASKEEAMQSLIDYSGFEDFVFLEIEFSRENGNLILKARGEYPDEENSCIFGRVDLITGDIETFDSLCYIN